MSGHLPKLATNISSWENTCTTVSLLSSGHVLQNQILCQKYFKTGGFSPITVYKIFQTLNAANTLLRH